MKLIFIEEVWLYVFKVEFFRVGEIVLKIVLFGKLILIDLFCDLKFVILIVCYNFVLGYFDNYDKVWVGWLVGIKNK